MNPITILIVDDHPLMREAMHTALDEEPDLEVIDEASDGAEGIRLFKESQPDVIIMDLLMPGTDGLEAIAQIRAVDPQARILAFTSMENEERVLAAIQAGALGYFPKTAPRASLLEAVRTVAAGKPYLPSDIAVKLFSSLRSMKLPAPVSELQEPLTARQQEILALLAEGRSDYEIGKTLHLEESTVRSHVHHMLQRLGLENRAQLVAYATQQYKQE
jgi:DNA-binding NarL/FixJ family response regulator